MTHHGTVRRQSARRRGKPRLLVRRKARCGSLLLEAIVAVGIFALFLGGIGLTLVLGERTTVAGGDRTRGAFFAEQQLEAVRQIRSQSFSSVSAGTKGVTLNAAGIWAFSGTSITKNGYTMNVVISSKGTDWMEVQSNVSWNFKNTRSGSIVLNTYLTDWRKGTTIGNWANMSRIANTSVSGSPDFQKVSISGNYAYLTSGTSAGKGIYVYNITNPASPVRVSSSFDLGVAVYGVAAIGNRLYIATASSSQEVQVYDITSPTTLTTGNLLNSYDLPGSGKARAIAVYDDNVFVGALEDSPNKAFYAIEMSETGPMTLLGSLGMSGSIVDIALQDGYAYVGNSYNVGEFQVVDIFDPENLSYAPGVGIDMTDVHDAKAIATFGTSALLGRINGSSIDELTLYDIGSSPVPSPPPGPWTLELGGDANALASISGSKYAFVGGSANNAELKVLDMFKFAGGVAPVAATFDTDATVKGMFYDLTKDRLYVVTASSLMVFSPG